MSTPVQQQYHRLKAENPEALLFFRLGDFYELFYEDAQLASRILGITLTARHKGSDNEMPMCGFPHHAHKEYLEKLVQAGYKVAIADQEAAEGKDIVQRKVVRVVTPGASLESGVLNPEENNFLAGIQVDVKKKIYALAYADLSTGDFKVCQMEDELSFFDELYKINPQEILIPSNLFEDESFCIKLPQVHVTVRSELSAHQASENLKQHFEVKNLEVFEIEKNENLQQVAGLVLDYLQETQKTNLTHIQKLVCYQRGDFMQVDQQTLRHLEIIQTIQVGEGDSTLRSVFEKSGTAMGGRVLFQALLAPLLNHQQINQRLEAVDELTKDHDLLTAVTQTLNRLPDLERLLARLSTGRGNARDLVFLREALSRFPKLHEILKDSCLVQDTTSFTAFEDLYKNLERALAENPPIEITAGGMFQDGYDEKLDGYRVLSQDSETWLNNFLVQKKQESGIQNLRIKYSKTFGFCLEVSKGQKANVPESWIGRQTLVNAERYTTPELASHEQKALSAEEQSFAREHELFQNLREEVIAHIESLQKSAQAIGQIDFLNTLARTAQKNNWTKPAFAEATAGRPEILEIEKGRHPVVEALGSEKFIANDLSMDQETSRMHLITGPNMAGKSTFLRQNALLIWLAQMGSFVPAKSYQAGIFDRIFTRVGASDNLAAGKSTFFVEMAETAHILNAATEHSFIILDEIGRGTSTFDGLSLAWAITEYIHNHIKSKTLFATHYHELIELVEDLFAAENFHVSVSQNETGIVFLRKILKGGIADSFGIEVAKYAGIPASVIKNAQEVLQRLESENLLSGKPNLFTMTRKSQKITAPHSRLEEALGNLDPDQITPLQALEHLAALKKIHQEKS